MSKKQKKEKLMLESLEHIVAGEKLDDAQELDKDTKAALEFTREMTNWAKTPPKEFEKHLKTRITHQLAEQEKQESLQGGFRELHEYLRGPVWRLTMGAITAVVIAGIIYLVVCLINN